MRRENGSLKKVVQEMRKILAKKKRMEERELMGKIKNLEQKMKEKDKRERKNNIIIKGMRMGGVNLKEKMDEWVSWELGA